VSLFSSTGIIIGFRLTGGDSKGYGILFLALFGVFAIAGMLSLLVFMLP
jgi:hypothetical protein